MSAPPSYSGSSAPDSPSIPISNTSTLSLNENGRQQPHLQQTQQPQIRNSSHHLTSLPPLDSMQMFQFAIAASAAMRSQYNPFQQYTLQTQYQVPAQRSPSSSQILPPSLNPQSSKNQHLSSTSGTRKSSKSQSPQEGLSTTPSLPYVEEEECLDAEDDGDENSSSNNTDDNVEDRHQKHTPYYKFRGVTFIKSKSSSLSSSSSSSSSWSSSSSSSSSNNNNTSGTTGKWRATISNAGQSKILGDFDTEIEAAKAYDSESRRVHKGSPNKSRLNFPSQEKLERSKNGRSVYRGISFQPKCNKWEVRIKHQGKMKYVGVYKDEAEAGAIWDMESIKLRGWTEATIQRLNFPAKLESYRARIHQEMMRARSGSGGNSGGAASSSSGSGSSSSSSGSSAGCGDVRAYASSSLMNAPPPPTTTTTTNTGIFSHSAYTVVGGKRKYTKSKDRRNHLLLLQAAAELQQQQEQLALPQQQQQQQQYDGIIGSEEEEEVDDSGDTEYSSSKKKKYKKNSEYRNSSHNNSSSLAQNTVEEAKNYDVDENDVEGGDNNHHHDDDDDDDEVFAKINQVGNNIINDSHTEGDGDDGDDGSNATNHDTRTYISSTSSALVKRHHNRFNRHHKAQSNVSMIVVAGSDEWFRAASRPTSSSMPTNTSSSQGIPVDTVPVIHNATTLSPNNSNSNSYRNKSQQQHNNKNNINSRLDATPARPNPLPSIMSNHTAGGSATLSSSTSISGILHVSTSATLIPLPTFPSLQSSTSPSSQFHHPSVPILNITNATTSAASSSSSSTTTTDDNNNTTLQSQRHNHSQRLPLDTVRTSDEDNAESNEMHHGKNVGGLSTGEQTSGEHHTTTEDDSRSRSRKDQYDDKDEENDVENDEYCVYVSSSSLHELRTNSMELGIKSSDTGLHDN